MERRVVMAEKNDWRIQKCQHCGSQLLAGNIECPLIHQDMWIGQNHYCRVLFCPVCEPKKSFTQGKPLEIGRLHPCLHPSSREPQQIDFSHFLAVLTPVATSLSL